MLILLRMNNFCIFAVSKYKMKLICVEGNYTESPEVVDNQMTKRRFLLKTDSIVPNCPFFI